MYEFVSDYIPKDVIKNPYYFKQPFYKCLSHRVLQVYEATPENRDKYPFSVFTQKHVNIILETEQGKLIGLNHNPKLGWTFPTRKAIHSFDTNNIYVIDGKYAVYKGHVQDLLVFLFIENKVVKNVPSSTILSLKKQGKFRECTNFERLEILYSL